MKPGRTPRLILGVASAALALMAVARTRSQEPSPTVSRGEKHRGVSWVAGPEIEAAALDRLREVDVNRIMQTPFGWQRTHDSPEIRLETKRVYWGERDEGLEKSARWASERGIESFLKPHIWLTQANGKWRSDIEMSSDANWDRWFASYRKFILHYAELAERLDIDGLVLGTELHRTVVAKPKEWSRIIREVRAVYSGELTYAANWYREYEDVPFWNELDYIGIQAYFPLSANDEQTSVAELIAGWAPHLESLRRLQARYSKPVLFTEIGYKSTPGAVREPWVWLDRKARTAAPVDLELQARAYRAFFETFWTQPWFAGAYFWKWHAAESRASPDVANGPDFSPQGKPAEAVLREWYRTTAD